MFIGSRAENNWDKVRKNRHAKGVDIQTAKITEETALRIREDPRTPFEIALEYGLTWGHVNKIKRGEVWKHV